MYVYFTYGMHFCANVVTGREGIGEAVLLRAVEPLAGLEIMKRNRGLRPNANVYDLTNGPAKLCEAFDIGRTENGSDLLSDSVMIAQNRGGEREVVVATTRIGIRLGTEHRWRFHLKNNPWVSRR